MNRIDIIVKMVNRGASYERIGGLLGLTRQRIHQLYRRMYPIVETSECEICGKEGKKKDGYTLCDSCRTECTRLRY